MNIVLAKRLGVAAIGIALLPALAPAAASADIPGPHPAYVHALHDLRYARFLIERPSAPNVEFNENAATREIDRAIFEVTRASYDDGKNVFAPAATDVDLDRHGRLLRALELLRGAHRDLADNVESDGAAAGWRDAAFRHVDAAAAFTRRALRVLFADRE